MAVDDVDDVIGEASRLQDAKQDSLSVDEVKDIARQVGVDDAEVAPALESLRARRENEHAERARRRALAVRVGILAAAVFVVCAFGLIAGGLSARGPLRDQLSRVDAGRAQLENVLLRQREVERRMREQGAALDARTRDAELAGSENRVAVEARRYDAAAVEYNRAVADGIFASVGRAFGSLPKRVPTGAEVIRTARGDL